MSMLAVVPKNRRYDWVSTSETLAEFYRRDFSHILESVYPARYPTSWASRPFVPLPYVRDLAKSHAVWYRRPPTRKWLPWDGSQAPEQALSTIYQTLGVDRVMRAMSERMVVQGTVLGVVLPRIGERGWTLHLADPYECEVDADPHDSSSVSAAQEIRIRVPVRSSHQTTQYGILHMTPTEIWMDTGSGRINPYRPNGRDLSNPWAGTPNPYPVWVARQDEPEAGDFYAPLADDLLHVQTEIVCAISDALHVGSWMSAGQPVLTGAQAGTQTEFVRGAEYIIPLAEGQTLDIIAPQSQLDPYLSAISKTMEYSRVLQGLPDSPMKSRALTAMAKAMERLDQDSYRADMLSGLTVAEQGLYRAIRQTHSWNFGAPRVPELPPCRVDVRYQEPELPVDVEHAANAQALRISQGLDSPVDVIARERGISRDEARQIWMQNLADRDAMQGGASDGT